MTQAALLAIFAELAERRGEVLSRAIAAEFAADGERFQRFHVAFDDLLYDYSKQRIDAATLDLLIPLARAAEVEAKRDAMFRGDLVNSTERRAALHSALAQFLGQAGPRRRPRRHARSRPPSAPRCSPSPATCARAACAARSANR